MTGGRLMPADPTDQQLREAWDVFAAGGGLRGPTDNPWPLIIARVWHKLGPEPGTEAEYERVQTIARPAGSAGEGTA